MIFPSRDVVLGSRLSITELGHYCFLGSADNITDMTVSWSRAGVAVNKKREPGEAIVPNLAATPE